MDARAHAVAHSAACDGRRGALNREPVGLGAHDGAAGEGDVLRPSVDIETTIARLARDAVTDDNPTSNAVSRGEATMGHQVAQSEAAAVDDGAVLAGVEDRNPVSQRTRLAPVEAT